MAETHCFHQPGRGANHQKQDSQRSLVKGDPPKVYMICDQICKIYGIRAELKRKPICGYKVSKGLSPLDSYS